MTNINLQDIIDHNSWLIDCLEDIKINHGNVVIHDPYKMRADTTIEEVRNELDLYNMKLRESL